MFEDSTFESTGKIKTRSRRWMIATLALNGTILAILVLMPLIYLGCAAAAFSAGADGCAGGAEAAAGA